MVIFWVRVTCFLFALVCLLLWLAVWCCLVFSGCCLFLFAIGL